MNRIYNTNMHSQAGAWGRVVGWVRPTILLVLMTMFFSSCSKPVTIYSIDKAPSQSSKHSRYKNKTIKIAYPKSIKDMMSSDIVIKYAPNRQSIYAESFWSENINRLTMAFITEVLESSHIFKTTINYSSYIKSDYLLESYIHQMHHQITSQGSEALLSIKLNLLDSYSYRLLKTKRFDYRIPTKSQDVQGYIQANQKAFDRLKHDLIRWLMGAKQ
ncbi:MAG: ABC-type transport auxiliary lipoprotein family protein [Campylobacterota bacterium]|nr:ABC-type transport auxiliary lipoprotein family protein [Campylobacterota bacterium]